jgi:class 3 adenylate cyclase
VSIEPHIQYCSSSSGVNIAFYAIGDGPLLFVLPGLPGQLQLDAQSQASEVYERLSRAHTVVRFDFSGTGLSQHGGIVPTGESCAGDIQTVLDHLGGERCALYATGFSCLGAMRFAARNPDRVERLVLWEGYAGRSDLGAQIDTLTVLLQNDYDMFIETIARTIIGWDDPQNAEPYDRMLRSAMSRDEWLQFLLQPDESVGDELQQITCPTLVIHHRDAALIPMETIQRLVAKIPNARLALFDGAAVGTQAEPARAAVDRFLRPEGSAPHAQAAAVQKEPASRAGGLQTVLFTDLVGHTEMMRRLGDERGREVLREHERITRELLKQHGGAEVKTMGDGFMASFASVTKAMDCAIALQRAFAAWNGGDGAEAASLQVRVGLNAGEPIEEDGDLFGSTVIMASRIAAQAGAGEILIPEPLRHLLTGKSYVYADRGETMLKGFEDAVRLYEVRWREDAGERAS